METEKVNRKVDGETILEHLNELISYHESVRVHNRDSLLRIYRGVEEFHRFCVREDGTPDRQFYRQATGYPDWDVEGFLLHLPFELAKVGLVDEALNVGRWFADLSRQPGNFYRDMGCILAEAGRREEALKQIEENLRRFPDDVWVMINAGDALYALGDKGAEEYFLKGYKMAGGSGYDRAGALERLIDFYRWQGMKEKADAFEAEYDRVVFPTPPKQVVNPKKVGRNDPCPCGSGKKYKKCCLNKTIG